MTTQTKPQAKPAEKSEKEDEGIGVKDLAKEFGMEPRAVRLFLRSEGFKARKDGGSGGNYTWDPKSSELTAIRSKLKAKQVERAKKDAEAKAEAAAAKK